MPRLRRVDSSEPGIARVRHGRGFRYLEHDGTPVVDREVAERIRELAIPPAWDRVWICPHPRGHIQATGYDAAGRKQYLYHPAWRERQDRLKFAQMEEFARALPDLRERVTSDLARRGLVRERVLGCGVRLLDLGFFRIGSERYVAENETFGLATLRRSHLHFERGVAVFDYRAKGSFRHRQEVADASVLPTLRALKRRRGGGADLLAYRRGRTWVDVRSEEINEYLRDVAGGDFTAKDFRTWNATVLAAVELAGVDLGPSPSKAARKRAAREATERVADYLSNTPAVCRSAYIDPRVFDLFDSGETIRRSLKRIVSGSEPGEFPDREQIERAVLRLIS
ncbi:MAG TPA: DNA topoisomerase IB [Solirubrobacterales bacterium]|jgi:DNA topoisomerase IB|nr:DNA topoisomerase IB [Solirubrobacterales bacterium]